MISKHAEKLQGVENVVPSRDLIIKMAESVLRYSAPHATLDVSKNSVKYEAQMHEVALSEKSLEVISVSLFARREELRAIFTQLVLRRTSDSYLVDYNYNIELCLASGELSKVMEPLLVLELLLRDGGRGEKARRVVLELSHKEAQTFVQQLAAIEKELVQA